MDILSNSPLPTGSLVWRPRPDAWVLTVFCKSTYTLSPGQSFLAPASMQEAPVLEDRWVGGVGEGSLLVPSDALPFKRYVDVIVLGHVHTAKHPVPSLIASLSVGPVHKSIEVWADRFWNPAGKLLVENAFAAMPIRWERSAGGPGSENPVGIPIPAPPNDQGLRPLPNFQPPGFALSTPYDRIPIVGFGPIAPTWPEREGRLRQYAYGWDHMRYISHPLPGDIDAAYFNASSADMGLPEFEGTETLSLIHLHFEHNWLVTKLALQKPKALVRKPNIPEYPVKLRCDTLIIDTDKGICSLIYRALLPLSHPEEEGHIEFSIEAPPLLAVPQPFVGTDSDTRRKTGPLPVIGVPQPQPEPEDLSKTIPFPEGAGAFPLVPPPGIQPAPFMGAMGGPPSTIPPPPLPSPATLPPPPLPLPASVPPPPLPFSSSIPPPMPLPAELALPLAPAPPPPPIPETPAVEPEGLKVLRLASLSAALAEQRTPAHELLKAEGLSSAELDHWRARFEQEVEHENRCGQSQVRERFDQAYVEALAPLRGPVLLGDFAALLVGMERGNVNEVLHSLGLHPASLMPILRYWTRQSASDSGRALELVAALSAERQKE